MNYKTGNPLGLQYEFNNDTAYFQKDIRNTENIDTGDEAIYQPSGTRIYNDFSVRYNHFTLGHSFIPQATLRNINTFYDQDTIDRINNNQTSSSSENHSIVVPQFTLDTGLIFEKMVAIYRP